MHRLRIASTSMAALAVLLALGSCASVFVPERDARAPALDGYGSVSMPVTTAVPEARELFLRGMQQTYAFNETEAARAFRAALARDPECAMCAWGVALAAGPNINNTDRGDLDNARQHLLWAKHHMGNATPRERALIQALSDRYGPASFARLSRQAVPEAPICGAAGAARAHPLDIVYAARMRAIADAYPDDPDVLSLYTEAVMIATRDDWWDKKTGLPVGEIGVVTDRLERALRTLPGHIGLNHYLIHAADSSPRPERATAAADRLGGLAPESPHLLHMSAHILVRIGRYHDATRVNEEALAAQARLKAALDAGGYSQSVDWDGHNRHFLWFAALTEGRGDLALEQARALAARAAKGKNASSEFMRSLPLLTLVRLERWSEVLKEAPAPGEMGIALPIADYAYGVALVRTGQLAAARMRSAELQAALDAPVLKGQTIFGEDAARTVLDILAGRLLAEIATAEAQPDAASVALARASELEAALNANEPPLLGSASRVALGSLMLRARRWADAERAFRDELVAQPQSGWALTGLQHSLAGQGRAEDAARTRGEAERAWAAADTALRGTVLR